MMNGVKEKRLAVLGGCGGLGRALVARAQAEGWRIAVLDLPASLERWPPPDGVTTIAIDAADGESVANAFRTLDLAFRGLEGFVNFAGFLIRVEPLADLPAADFEAQITGNLTANFLAAKAALPLLRKGENPALVSIASGLARHTRPGYGAYAMAKAGIIAMTNMLAQENAPWLRANTVAPGAVDTAFLRGGTGRSNERNPPTLDIAAYSQMIPLKRIAVPEDIVGPVLFLLGPDSAYMTGQTLWVNGGAYMP